MLIYKEKWSDHDFFYRIKQMEKDVHTTPLSGMSFHYQKNNHI